MEGRPFEELVESERQQLAVHTDANIRAAQREAELAVRSAALEEARLAEVRQSLAVMYGERDVVLRGLRGVRPEIYICSNSPGAFKSARGWDMRRVSIPRIRSNEDGPSVPYTDMSRGLALGSDGRLFYTYNSHTSVTWCFRSYPEHRAEEVVFRDSLNANVVLSGESHQINIEDMRRGLARLKARTNT